MTQNWPKNPFFWGPPEKKSRSTKIRTRAKKSGDKFETRGWGIEKFFPRLFNCSQTCFWPAQISKKCHRRHHSPYYKKGKDLDSVFLQKCACLCLCVCVCVCVCVRERERERDQEKSLRGRYGREFVSFNKIFVYNRSYQTGTLGTKNVSFWTESCSIYLI